MGCSCRWKLFIHPHGSKTKILLMDRCTVYWRRSGKHYTGRILDAMHDFDFELQSILRYHTFGLMHCTYSVLGSPKNEISAMFRGAVGSDRSSGGRGQSKHTCCGRDAPIIAFLTLYSLEELYTCRSCISMCGWLKIVG